MNAIQNLTIACSVLLVAGFVERAQASQIEAPTLARSGQTLRWTKVPGADKYNVYENDQYLDTVQSRTYRGKPGNDYYVVSVDEDVSPTSFSVRSNTISLPDTSTTACQPDAPALTINGSELSWLPTKCADGYNVYQDDRYLTTIPNTSYQLAQSGSYYITAFDWDVAPTQFSVRSNAIQFNGPTEVCDEQAQPSSQDPATLADDKVNLCAGFETGTDQVVIKPMAKPPYRQYYKDPAFGAKIIRISNASQGEVFKPAYSTMQAWNMDESLLLLYRSGSRARHLLLDGHTYEKIRELDITPSDIEEVFWSYKDPNTFFYVSKYSSDFGEFRRFDVKNNSSTLIRKFDDICGERGLPVAGGNVQMQSHDDDLFSFRCRPQGSERYIMFTYRISTDEVIVKPLGDGTPYDPWSAPNPAPSGERVWLQGQVLSTDLDTIEQTLDMAVHHEHSSVGQTHDGQDAYFQTVFNASPGGCNDKDPGSGIGHLVVHNMKTGECRPIINQARGYPYTTSGTHVSAVAWKRPGWVAMSSIGYGSFDYQHNGEPAPALLSEIYLANTDPENEVICRLAQHRSYAKSATKGGYTPYLGEPHATISPSGTRILFGSDWYDSGAVDAYVIELPAYQGPKDPGGTKPPECRK